MLEKDKDYIEFSMRTMMVTHKPYQWDSEISITGLIPRDFIAIDNPLDIPGDVVVVPKKDFEALQTENEQLKKKLHELDHMQEVEEYLKKLYSIEDVENFKWVLNHVCGGRALDSGWIAISLFWKRKYEALSKIVGFSSYEELHDYLTNEVNCETLHEAMLKLIDEKKYACKEWCEANSKNNSWKATAECNSPKELMAKLNQLRDNIEEWQKATGCKIPEAAKDLIESNRSWHHAYNQVVENNRKLTDEVESWKKAIRDYDINIQKWREATGYSTPEVAKEWVTKLGKADRKLGEELLSWQEATGCSTPEEAKKKLKDYKNRLDSTKQSASIAIRHLDNIVFRDDKRSDWSDK